MSKIEHTQVLFIFLSVFIFFFILYTYLSYASLEKYIGYH
jgi:hypothetical protein